MRNRRKRRRAWLVLWSVSAIVLSVGAGADEIQIGTATIPVASVREAVMTMLSKVAPAAQGSETVMAASAVKYAQAEATFTGVQSDLVTVYKKPGLRAPIEKTEFVPEGAPHMLCVYVREQGHGGAVSCFPFKSTLTE